MRTEALDMMREQEKVLRQMRKQLDNMSIDAIDREIADKRIISNELKRVQRVTRNAAKSALNGDQMQASKGVRMTQYKQVMGGNINILKRRRQYVDIDTSKYNRQSRRYRSERSKLIASYWGESRSFVLRIQQHGTVNRTAGTRYSSRGGSGNRGKIIAKDFMSTTRNEMQVAADNIIRQLSFMDQLFLME